MAYLGVPRCDAPLWPDHENFLQATLYEKVRFLPFSSKNCKIQQWLMVFCISKFQKNGRICGFHRTFRSKKCFSFRGASPTDPRPGALSWTSLGAPPSDPRYRLALRALAMPPFCQILNTPLRIVTSSLVVSTSVTLDHLQLSK